MKTSRSGAWVVRETPCFRVYTLAGQAGVTHLPGTCEALRKHLQTTWLGKEPAAWTPKCDIVLHPSVEPYRKQLGPGSDQSSGCATIQIDSERVVRRRIDLRADAADWITAALPHELTHVVVADRFTRKQIPRWADEGMAILAEPPSKQLTRQRAMEACFAGGHHYSADQLIRLTEYPDSHRRNAFYGQSAALVAHFARESSPAEFLNSLATATERESSLIPKQTFWKFAEAGETDTDQGFSHAVSRIVAAVK